MHLSSATLRSVAIIKDVLAVLALLAGTGQTVSTRQPNQMFYCNTGYEQRACDQQVRQLRDALSKIDLAPLGEWSWVLVRSQDWKPILNRAGRDPDSPAFTILAKRQTFLEEALFVRDPQRTRTLLEKYRLPLGELLLVALSHELAHAICRETDEAKTNAHAEQLRATGTIACRDPLT